MIVVIPMAGEGRRFKEAGYTFPKPLITIRNKPMIQWVVESLNMPWAQYVFVVQKAHAEQYDLEGMCQQLAPKAIVHWVDGLTGGAASSVLLGLTEPTLRHHDPLLIVNSDQWLSWDSQRFWRCALRPEIDGAIPVFQSTHPKWSYARLDDRSRVVEVAEKRCISPWATCGLYYWKSVETFRDAAKSMMLDDKKRVNGEWYVAPVYNELIQQGGQVMAYPDVEMWGLGTPEDLEEFKLKVCR